MKKAVIQTGSKQYLVQEGEVLQVELLKSNGKNVSFEPLLVIDEASVRVGAPLLSDIAVTAEIIEQDVKAEKVTAVRFKAKKRVHKLHGHRQHHTSLRIVSIA